MMIGVLATTTEPTVFFHLRPYQWQIQINLTSNVKEEL